MIKKLLLFSLILTAFNSTKAQFSGGDGSQNNPFLISTFMDLVTLSDSSQFWDSNYYFLQNANIDASASRQMSNGEGFTPIGIDLNEPFLGKYDGNNFSINHLFIERNIFFNIGLFGYLGPGSEIKNLNLIDANIWGFLRTGGIAGFNERGRIVNCFVSGRIMGGSFVGGICGGLSRDSIVNCRVDAEIVGTGNYVGGITGINNDGVVWRSNSMGSVSSINRFVGGIVGWNLVGSNGPVVIGQCYSMSHVTGNNSVGGIVGSNEANVDSALIFDCYSTGNIKGVFEVGGVVGNNVSNNGNALVLRTYYSGRVSGLSDLGGIAGRMATSNGTVLISNSYYFDINPNGAGGTPLNMGQLTSQSSFSGFNFSDIWGINTSQNCGLPSLTTIANKHLLQIPQVLDVKSALMCGPGSTQLSAKPEHGLLKWLNASQASLLHVGDTLQTTVLTQTTAYWAIAESGNCSSSPKEVKASLISQHGLHANKATICSPEKVNVILHGSEENVRYYVHDASNDTLISGPFEGNGDSLILETNIIHSDMTFRIHGNSTPAFKANKGASLQFDGVDDYVLLGNHESYKINKGTIETWFKIPVSGAGVGFRALVVKESAFGIFLNSNILVVRDFTCGCIRNTNIPVNDDKWHHVAMVFDSAANNMDLYLDGVQVLSNRPFGILNQNNAFTLAAGNPAGTTQNLNGQLDETKIWNITKSPQEIIDGMHACLKGNETGLVAYFIYEDGTGSGVLSNKVAAAPNGMLQNMNTSWAWLTGFKCESCEITMSQTASVSINETPEPPSASDTQSFCFQAKIVELEAVGQSIKWYLSAQGGENLHDLDSLTDGTSYYASQTVDGCESVLRYPVWVQIHSVNVGIEQQVDTLFALAQNAEYQWLNCFQNFEKIVDETQNKFTPTLSGSYAVEVAQNGCIDTSECILMAIGSVNDRDKPHISVYPNPVSDLLLIATTFNNHEIPYFIYHSNGSLILSGKLIQGNTYVNMQNVASGVYFLKILDSESKVFKIIKE
jgi:hypothetical protein